MESQNNSATNPKQTRKVHYGYHSHQSLNRNLKSHPVIRLGGKYLEKFDFNIGDSIDVRIDKGKISIEKIPAETIEIRKREMETARVEKGERGIGR